MKFLQIESMFGKSGHRIRKFRTCYDFSAVLGWLFVLEKLYAPGLPRELGRDYTSKRWVLISRCVNLCSCGVSPSAGHCVKQQFFNWYFSFSSASWVTLRKQWSISIPEKWSQGSLWLLAALPLPFSIWAWAPGWEVMHFPGTFSCRFSYFLNCLGGSSKPWLCQEESIPAQPPPSGSCITANYSLVVVPSHSPIS